MINEKEEYFILPGNTIGNPGLPGGKLEAKTKPLKVDKKYYPHIGSSFEYLIAVGKMITGTDLAKQELEKKDSDQDDKEIAKKLKALNKEAKELEVEIPTDATIEEIEALIDAKKKELEG